MINENRSRAPVALLYCLVQILYWSSGFATVGLAAAYLGRIGFSSGSIGFITAAAGPIGFMLVLCLSVRIDRAGPDTLYRVIAGLLTVQILLIAGLALSRYAGVVTALLYTLFLSHAHVMNSLFSKLYINLKKCGLRIDFGVARGLGSLAYGCSSFAAGYLMARHPERFVHSLTLIFYTLLLFVILALRMLSRRVPLPPDPVSPPAEEHPPLRLGAFLWNYRLFFVVALGLSIVSASNKTFTTFLVTIVEELGGDIRSFTAITGFLALIEIPLMLFFSKLRRKRDVPAMLLASLLLYAAKLGGAAWARSLPVLFAAVTAQAFAAGLYHPARVEYVREVIPHRDTAKCLAILDGTPVFLSFLTILGSGRLLDSIPARTVCLLLFLLALLGTLISGSVIFRVRPPAADDGRPDGERQTDGG